MWAEIYYNAMSHMSVELRSTVRSRVIHGDEERDVVLGAEQCLRHLLFAHMCEANTIREHTMKTLYPTDLFLYTLVHSGSAFRYGAFTDACILSERR